MTPTKIRNFITQKHVKGCTAMKAVKRGTWRTPWYFTGETDWRRGKRYLVLKCNSQKCQAHLIVNEEDLLAANVKLLKFM